MPALHIGSEFTFSVERTLPWRAGLLPRKISAGTMAVFSYIKGWYNPARRHSGIGYLSPIAYEARTLTATEMT
jgi:transposase InsO family protein